MKRGELFISVLSADYGKARPAVIVQTDDLRALDSVILCGLTSDVSMFGPTRILVPATTENGLESDSLIMAEKISAVPRSRCRQKIGILEPELLAQLNALLPVILGIAD